MRLLMVDDEPLARLRLRSLLEQRPLADMLSHLEEAAHAAQAWDALRAGGFDVVLLDIQLPGLSGLELAKGLRTLSHPPSLVFVTAHPEHALQAFDLQAVDYLTKPVRAERLQQCLERIAKLKRPDDHSAATVTVQERGATHRIGLHEVLYLKAELKYLTLRTLDRTYLMEGSLQDIEARYPDVFVRIHRNALVAAAAIQTLERNLADTDADSWQVRLRGVPDALQVSRRQLQHVRSVMKPAPAHLQSQPT
jgi:two-component system, LytTR family, response regulator AlgR